MEQRRRRIEATERPVVAHVGPYPGDIGLALGEHRHGGVVAVKPLSGEHMRLDQKVERPQGGGTRADLRSEEHTSELQSLMRISYAVSCLNKKPTPIK